MLIVSTLMAVDPLHGAAAEAASNFERTYTTNAYITLFGITIFSRNNVGSGFASFDKRKSGDESAMTLRFMSASDPVRAHGLNRFGFIQEDVTYRGPSYLEGRYLGLMTASKEETLNDAKQALNQGKSGESLFVASQGGLAKRLFHYSLRHVALSQAYAPSDIDAVVRRVQTEFATSQRAEREATQAVDQPETGTFLWAVSQAIQSTARSTTLRFNYNGSNFQLRIDKREDAAAGQTFAQSGLVSAAARVIVLNGVILRDRGGQASSFRLWFDSDSANFLPLRFEMRPRSFLRLVYEATSPLPKSPPRIALLKLKND